MKVLILSCHTGEGHNAAARALKAQFDNLAISCDIKDALCFGFKGKSALFSKGHVFLYKHLPRVFGAGYAMLEMNRKNHALPLLYRTGKGAVKKLQAFVVENGYDAVLCTHTFAACAMSAARKENGFSTPFYLIITDYTCYPGLCDVKADAFFVPHKDLLWEFTAEGISPEKLIASGLPVAHEFETALPKEEAAERLGLKAHTKRVLLSGGGMGCGNMEAAAQRCAKALEDGEELVVICGKNDSLRKALWERKLPRTTVVGYTSQMSLYMDSADLFITKAGGLSSTEAAKKGLPILYMDAVPGCETHNLYFFCQKGFAKAVFCPERLAAAVRQMLSSPAALAKMSERMKEAFPKNTAKVICEYVIQKYNQDTLQGDVTHGSSNQENS
ncbi:MAG: glycosyltransferase [Clostridia bacterium]|nr:glycosyltransferase [Clostridia bacterium]